MSNTQNKSTAVLLIAHGSRRAEANEDLSLVADQLRTRRPELIVEISYLELAEPTIPQGAAACVRRGAMRVQMLPYFLSAGAHVTNDLEGFRNQFSQENSDVEFELCEPLGRHPLLVDILLDRIDK